MKNRVLTGIQSSGRPHLGNALGAILPAIKLAESTPEPAFYFVADLHSLTTLHDAKQRIENTKSVAAAWLAFGFDAEANYLYRQSQIPEVCELTWYLSCFTSFGMLSNATSFKDKSDEPEKRNGGLFTYPVLMAADILLYDAELVPVGKDQKQHLEMSRAIARAFNNEYGDVFTVPKPLISEDVQVVPGTDKRKMSKSYGNYIDIFLTDNEIKKQVMSIKTDSTPIESPKDPDQCTVFQLFSMVADSDNVADLKEGYEKGGVGYGEAKKLLLDSIIRRFQPVRERYLEFMNDEETLYGTLSKGESRVRKLAKTKLEQVRECVGF